MGKRQGTIISTLGQGAQGIVHEVKINSRRYALKIYNKSDNYSVSAQRRARKIGEVIHKPKTGALSRAWMVDNGEDETGNPVMLHKLFAHPPIEDYFSSYQPSNKLRIRERIAVGLTAGIVEIHRNGITHADLAPINVLYSKSGEVAIIDFDGAGYFPRNKDIKLDPIVHGHVQFPNWVTPYETLKGTAKLKTDVWWLGGIIMKILTGYSPFFFLKYADDDTLKELLELIYDNGIYRWPPRYESIHSFRNLQPNLTPGILNKICKVINNTIASAVLGKIFSAYFHTAKRPSSIDVWSSFRSRVFR